ncbi:MAG: DHH family phosphoesterase [Lachnospiraceae bacterium]|nr:DHH family phosphoesterase [Lachnospiraceae bacterium]
MNKKLKFKGRLRLYFRLPVWFGILLGCTDAVIYTIDVTAGVILSGFTLIYLLCFLFLEHFNRSVIMNELVSFATQYGQIQKRLLRDLELPNALLDESGRVIWANRAFQQIVGKERPENKPIFNYFPEISKDRLPIGEEDATEVEFQQDDKDFHAKLKRIPLAEMVKNSDIFESDGVYDGCLISVYLFDETALKIAIRENDNQSLAVGLLYIDNYEEALDSIEEVRRSLLTALIERKVNKYFASIDGIVRKMEKDKFFFILRKQSLKVLQENRFDLLEDVKTVNIGNDMSVTLSIGVGVGGLSYSQNYEYARTSIDLALGRGGDQAVVKTKEGVSYYGGKSQRVEKNTRVKARVKAHALKEIISSKDRVIVMGHRMTDIDSFGASVGIYRIAKALGRSAYIVINDIMPSIRPMVDHFISHEEEGEEILIGNARAEELAGANTCLVVVDVNKPSITECPELLKMCRSIVVLDHHRQSEEIIENATLSYVETYASSACEMVTEVIQYVESGLKLRSAEADCLYGGIVIDTNNFISKAGVRTFEAAAYLRRNGADVTRVRKMLRDDLADYRAKAEAISKASIFRDVYAISTCVPEEAHNPTVVGAQAANELLNVTGIKASFVLTDYHQVIYISARSIDEVNVQIIMERLGGGGHLNVAAAQLSEISLEEATEKLKETLTEMSEKGEI